MTTFVTRAGQRLGHYLGDVARQLAGSEPKTRGDAPMPLPRADVQNPGALSSGPDLRAGQGYPTFPGTHIR